MDANDNSEECASPCVRNCCLDVSDVCVGCYRTLDEILNWHSSTLEERERLLGECLNRKKDRAAR